MDHGNSTDWAMGLSLAEQARLDHMISSLSSEDLDGLNLDLEPQDDDSTAGFQFNRDNQAFLFNGGPSYQDSSNDEAASRANLVAARDSGTQPTDSSLFSFDLSPLEPAYDRSPETQSLKAPKLSTEQTCSQADARTTFPAAAYAPPSISSSLSSQNRFYQTLSDQTSMFGNPKPRRRTSPHKCTSVSESPINKRKAMAGKAHPKKDIHRLEMSLQPYLTTLPHAKRMAAIWLGQLKLLIDEVELKGSAQPRPPSRLSLQPSNFSFTAGDVFSQDSFSNLGVLDSGYRTEDDSSMSSTPRPAINITKDEISMNFEPTQLQHTHRIIYECTKKDCCYSTHLEGDWIRHEQGEKHWPQEKFMCLACPTPAWDLNGNLMCSFCFASFLFLSDLREHYLLCVSAKNDGRTFGRSDHFCKHLREKHGVEHTTQHAETWKYEVNSAWPRQCGFCGIGFQNWNQRAKHVARHYQNGSKVKDWKLPFQRTKDQRTQRPDMDPNPDSSDDEGSFDDHRNKLRRIAPASSNPALQETQKRPERFVGYTRQSIGFQQESERTDWNIHDFPRQRSLKTDPSSSFLEPRLKDGSHEQFMLLEMGRVNVGTISRHFQSPSSEGTVTRVMLASRRKRLSEEHRGEANVLVFQLLSFSGWKKLHLAREYIRAHKSCLPGGIFWLQNRLTPEIEDSFWHIAFEAVFNSQRSSPVIGGLLMNVLAREYHSRRSAGRAFVNLSWTGNRHAHLFLLTFTNGSSDYPKPSKASGFWSLREYREHCQLISKRWYMMLIAYPGISDPRGRTLRTMARSPAKYHISIPNSKTRGTTKIKTSHSTPRTNPTGVTETPLVETKARRTIEDEAICPVFPFQEFKSSASTTISGRRLDTHWVATKLAGDGSDSERSRSTLGMLDKQTNKISDESRNKKHPAIVTNSHHFPTGRPIPVPAVARTGTHCAVEANGALSNLGQPLGLGASLFGEGSYSRKALSDVSNSMAHCTCPMCFKKISFSRPAGPDNCTCTEDCSFYPHQVQSYASSSLSVCCPEGPESEFPHINITNTFLPLSPEPGLNEAEHRRSSEFCSNMSYQMRRYLIEPENNEPSGFNGASSSRFLSEDAYVAPQISSKRHDGTLQSRSKQESKDYWDDGFDQCGVDLIAGIGAWEDGGDGLVGDRPEYSMAMSDVDET